MRPGWESMYATQGREDKRDQVIVKPGGYSIIWGEYIPFPMILAKGKCFAFLTCLESQCITRG